MNQSHVNVNSGVTLISGIILSSFLDFCFQTKQIKLKLELKFDEVVKEGDNDVDEVLNAEAVNSYICVITKARDYDFFDIDHYSVPPS